MFQRKLILAAVLCAVPMLPACGASGDLIPDENSASGTSGGDAAPTATDPGTASAIGSTPPTGTGSETGTGGTSSGQGQTGTATGGGGTPSDTEGRPKWSPYNVAYQTERATNTPVVALDSRWRPFGATGTSADCDTLADDCVFRDETSGLLWTEANPAHAGATAGAPLGFEEAKAACEALSFGGLDGWRLPSTEYVAAYENGLASVEGVFGAFFGASDAHYWFRSSVSAGADKEYVVVWKYNGRFTGAYEKTLKMDWRCVRSGS